MRIIIQTYCSLILWAVCSAFAAIRWTHIFQLNSYRYSTQLRWMKTHPTKLLPLLPVAAALGCAILKWDRIPMLCLCVCWLLVAAPVLFPRKAKKPLVYTGRVIRLLSVHTALQIPIVLTGIYLGGNLTVILPLTSLVLSPLGILVANWVCSPMEAAIRHYYTKDAIRILEACPYLLRVGVTGSYGKTSVKSYLGQLLDVSYDTLITPESYNTPMGVVRTVRERLRATHEVFVCEMGARHVGDIKELCDLVHPKHGIITAVGNQHLETFHTPEAIRKTKYELADALPEDGLLLVNGDCEAIRACMPSRPCLTYGMGEDNDYRAVDINVTTKGTDFTVVAPDGERCSFRMQLIGKHSVQNVTGAIAFCHAIGIPMKILTVMVRKLRAVPHRMRLVPAGDLVTYLDDAYNSNPAGCKAALEALNSFTDAYHVLITPGMVELGDDMEKCNEEFGAQAAAVCDLCILVGEKQAIPIRRGLLREGFPESHIRVVKSFAEGIVYAKNWRSERGQKRVILMENDLPDNY